MYEPSKLRRLRKKKAGLIEELVEIFVAEHDFTKKFKVGMNLRLVFKVELEELLREKLNVFAWKHADMVGIHLEVMCY